MNTANLLWGLIFSSAGFGFFLYGRKQAKPVPHFCGIALMAIPFFVGNTWLLVVLSLALIAVTYFVRT